MMKSPNILLLGKEGQVGRELQRSLATARLVALDRPGLDFERLDELRALVRRESPDVIVNAAAYTAVDRAESEPEICRRINAEAVSAVAEEARSLGALFVHYSTDYVFDGTKEGWYEETDQPKPLGVYGLTKLEGERAAATAGRHLVFRTSWVYAAHGHNFIRTMLKLAGSADPTAAQRPANSRLSTAKLRAARATVGDLRAEAITGFSRRSACGRRRSHENLH